MARHREPEWDAAAWEALLEPGATGMDAARVFLRRFQQAWNWIPRGAVEAAARHYQVRFATVYEEVYFSSLYRTEPCGKALVEVCLGLSCREVGSAEILEDLGRLSGVKPGTTAADGSLTLEGGACQGLCAMGPNARLNGKPHGVETPEKVERLLKRAQQSG